MEINVLAILVIVVLSVLAWWVNDKLNTVPILKTIIQVVIVVCAVILLLQNLGLMGNLDTHVRID